jgi:hypothetical protein
MPALARGLKVRVLRPPPTRILEGVDLGAQPFEQGRVYELEPAVANVLVLWEYAVRISHSRRSRKTVSKTS